MSTNDGNPSSSEDALLFGATTSHLFDTVASTVDNLITEGVSTLPLLPRSLPDGQQKHPAILAGTTFKRLTQRSQRLEQKITVTGEEKLLSQLHKSYKKNLDIAEAYCLRNIFTVAGRSKSQRKKILEFFLSAECNKYDGESGNNGDRNFGSNDDAKNGVDDVASVSGAACTSSLSTRTSANYEDFELSSDGAVNEEFIIPQSKYTNPPPNIILPTPKQIMEMDEKILVARRKLNYEKHQRFRLKTLFEEFDEAEGVLAKLEEQLKNDWGCDNSDNRGSTGNVKRGHSISGGKKCPNSASLGNEIYLKAINVLRKSINKAMKGHHELKELNTCAKEVLALMDQIKAERDEVAIEGGTKDVQIGSQGVGVGRVDGKRKKITSREEDELARKKIWGYTADDSGTNDVTGKKDDIKSLLEKVPNN